jgi:ElaB/YqjD/DUF883 family membrane-anchored ribosome-binding protein
MRHNGGRRPEEILAEIDRTRGEMDRTLTAIEQRLTPGQLVDQGISYFRQSGANEFVQNLGGAAKHNPLPVALAGIGIAWLMALGRQPAQHEGFGFTSSSPGGMREKASGAMQGISERMGSAKNQIGDTASSLRERAGHVTDTAREQWQKARGGIDYLVNEQPLVLGAIGLAIGAVLAAAAPRTRKEEEMMGEASRNLAEKAKEAGAQHLEKAQEVTKQAVAQATRKEPQSSGTTAAPPATPTSPRPPRQPL